MGFERLYKNLIDIIKEEQAKLGFRREAIRLYYPLSSLNHFFETEYSEEEMLNKLQELPDFIKETFMTTQSQMNLLKSWWNLLDNMDVR